MKDNSKKKRGTTYKAQGGAMRAVARSIKVRHLDAPPKLSRPKRIHPRHVLPFVPEGQERPFHSLNTRAVIHRPKDVTQDIQILLNTALAQPAQNRTASNVGEPSMSVNGDVVF